MLTLGNWVPDKSKTLTLKLDLNTLAEFAVASQIKRARSVSSFLHEYVVKQINEARQLVPAEEFERRVEDQKVSILARSSTKQREAASGGRKDVVVHVRSLGEMSDELQGRKDSAGDAAKSKPTRKAAR